MRRILALTLLAATTALAGPASATPECTYVDQPNGSVRYHVGVCHEYVCVDICAPEYHVDPQCSFDTDITTPPILLFSICGAIDRMYVVV